VNGESSLPRLIAVSLHKAGTHLVLRLVEEIGYHRCFFEPADLEAVERDTAEVFLEHMEPNAAYFLHECPVNGFRRTILEHWRAHGDPKFIYNYRDPRAVLLSQVNYLRQRHRRVSFSGTPYHLLFSDVLQAQPTERDALDVALQCMGDYLTESFLGSVWMLHHPQVLKLRYERLVGERGGGRADHQLEEVASVLRHLGLAGDPRAIAARLYDPSQATFHRGSSEAWREVYTPAQLQLFERRYGHLLDIYGYPHGVSP
jgi:hypothetical protein